MYIAEAAVGTVDRVKQLDHVPTGSGGVVIRPLHVVLYKFFVFVNVSDYI